MAKYSRVELSFIDHSRYSFELVDAKRTHALKQTVFANILSGW